jgi:hypothetical protein
VQLWPSTCVSTIGKGQKPFHNAKVSHTICGNIVDPGAHSSSTNKVVVCRGTSVVATILDTTGLGGSNTANSTHVICNGDTCSVDNIRATERYIARSRDGTDTDRMQFRVPDL